MSSFAVVVKSGNFTRAATRLGLSKSVVSRHVSALEKELGVQLLYRSTHRLTLTEAGERFYAYCRDLDQVVEQAAAVATASRETPRGMLRIAMPQTLVISPVGKMVTQFQQRYPEMHLDVRVTSLQVDPIEEAFDLALRIGDFDDTNVSCRKLLDMRFVAVASPRYIRRNGKPRSVRDLAAHQCLTYSEFDSRSRMAIPTAGQRTPSQQISLTTNSGVLLMHALLAGQGIVIGPQLMFEPHLRRKALVVVLDDFKPTALYAVFPPGRFASAGRTAFVDYLISKLGTASAARRRNSTRQEK